MTFALYHHLLFETRFYCVSSTPFFVYSRRAMTISSSRIKRLSSEINMMVILSKFETSTLQGGPGQDHPQVLSCNINKIDEDHDDALLPLTEHHHVMLHQDFFNGSCI